MENQNARQIIELDVRPILKAGGEPFSEIMNAVQKVPEGGALRLRATFKPTPLFNVLGKQGWNHEIEHGSGDDWAILFFKGAMEQSTEQPTEQLHRDYPELKTRLSTKPGLWTLDVRMMSPPEPMEMTLLVLEKLPKNTTLIQINERVPQFLLPLLEERGYQHHIEKNTESEVQIKIERKL